MTTCGRPILWQWRAKPLPTRPLPPRMKTSEPEAIALRLEIGSEALDGPLDAFAQRRRAGDPQALHRCDVENFDHLAIGLRSVPDEFPGKSGELPNRLGQFADRGAGAARYVDGLARIVAFNEK